MDGQLVGRTDAMNADWLMHGTVDSLTFLDLADFFIKALQFPSAKGHNCISEYMPPMY